MGCPANTTKHTCSKGWAVVQGAIVVKQLALADLQSIRNFTKGYLAEEKGPDLLILNAGVMACPQAYTKDGFEMQIGASILLRISLCTALYSA